MGSSYRGLRRVASFRPYTSKQVGDTGPAKSARRSNSHVFRSSFSGARGTPRVALFCKFLGLSCFELIGFESLGQIGPRAVGERVKWWRHNNPVNLPSPLGVQMAPGHMTGLM